jgi:hypothetical protein
VALRKFNVNCDCKALDCINFSLNLAVDSIIDCVSLFEYVQFDMRYHQASPVVVMNVHRDSLITFHLFIYERVCDLPPQFFFRAQLQPCFLRPDHSTTRTVLKTQTHINIECVNCREP